MATTVDLKLGLNLEIGSVPVALAAEVETGADQRVYTFDGSIQDADTTLQHFLSHVGQQFGLTVQLPPELNLEAKIDYLAGQVIITQPTGGAQTTNLGVAGQFEFITESNDVFKLQFYADAVFGDKTPTGATPFVVGVALDVPLHFSTLPVVGHLPGFKDLTLQQVGFSYTNANPAGGGPPVTFVIPSVTKALNPLFTRNDPTAWQSQTYAITTQQGAPGFQLNSGGFSLTAGLTQSGQTLTSLALPLGLPSQPPPATPAPFSPQATSAPASPVHWVSVNKTFGPVALQKIGLNYAGGEATFGLTAGFSLGGFTLDLEGLAITFPLPLPGQAAGKAISFALQGLGLDLKRGSLEVGGVFVKDASAAGEPSYYGEVMVQAAGFGLKALGGYTPGEPASFFIYANLEAPLGGPPFFFVTGLAAGFGLNRRLQLPTIAQLPSCPLLPGNAPPMGATPSDTVASVLPALKTMFVDQPGEYWVAAGVQFTSFEMITAFALVTVAFGVDMQVGLLGTCAMSFPKGDPSPVAYVEIDLVASLTPSTGLLAVDGQLAPASYVFGGFVQLSGGFAFYTWFDGAYKGDFVVTLGGYHPAFSKPAHYPTVPRLGLSFGLDSFQVTGQAYFALTPALMMGGLSLSATWSSGSISAWLNAGLDFQLNWAPFHYAADAYVQIGVQAIIGWLKLHVQVGADLSIWGPQFGGQANVSLYIVSFTIYFGSPAAAAPPLGWAAFHDQFLPKAPAAQPSQRALRTRPAAATPVAAAPPARNVILTAAVSSGLLQQDLPGYDWLVDPDGFAITTNSVVPATALTWNGAALPNDPAHYAAAATATGPGPFLVKPAAPQTSPSPAGQVWNSTLAIGPMSQGSIQSPQAITLTRLDGRTQQYTACNEVGVQPVLLDSSSALWAANNQLNSPGLVASTLVGVVLMPPVFVPHVVHPVPLSELLFTWGLRTGFTFAVPAASTRFAVTADTDPATQTLRISVVGAGAPAAVAASQHYVLAALADPWVAAQRSALLADLTAHGFGTYTAAQVSLLPEVQASARPLADWPAVGVLGAVLPV